MQNLRLSYVKEWILCRSVRLKGFSGVTFLSWEKTAREMQDESAREMLDESVQRDSIGTARGMQNETAPDITPPTLPFALSFWA